MTEVATAERQLGHIQIVSNELMADAVKQHGKSIFDKGSFGDALSIFTFIVTKTPSGRRNISSLMIGIFCRI